MAIVITVAVSSPAPPASEPQGPSAVRPATGCTDGETGRILLSRLAAHYSIPLIDCGVLLSSTGGTMHGIDARVTSVVPGAACLLCRHRIDLPRAAAEQLSAAELVDRQREGYAPEQARLASNRARLSQLEQSPDGAT